MKKIYFFVAALAMSLTTSAEVISLDLEHPTNPGSFTFNENGLWAETYNATDYGFFESQIFGFEHLPSGNSWGGTSWEGFTVSKATEDVGSYGYYSNVAKGGIRGEGTPYILGYYSEYWTLYSEEDNEDMLSSNRIIFNDGNAYYPRYMYVNNALVSYNNIMAGGGVARPFQKGDKFILRIQGLDENYEHDLTDGADIEVLLADFTSDNEEEWFVNTEWQKVDLSGLGQVYGLAFWMVSTDQSQSQYDMNYYTNTATYFALDGLTVSSTADEEIPTAINNTNEAVKTVKVIRNGQVIILRDGKAFNVLGAQL